MSNQDSVLQSKGFFASLFDISFRSFITLRFIKILYIIIIAILGIFTLFLFISTILSINNAAGLLLAIIISALFFGFNLIVSRLLLELIVVVFRIGENTSILVDRANPPASPGQPPVM